MPLGPGLLDELTRILGPDGLVASEEGRLVYECDMHTFYKGAPDVVALPKSTAEVLAIVRLCRRERVPIVPRGSGTGLIGGAMAPHGGVMIGLNRMTRILEIDLANRAATVQPGLINLWLTRAVQERGWFFAPDPSSQMVSSIGGNVSTNAGGPHCLKYGITANHVLGLELVTGAGEVVRLGGKVADRGRTCLRDARWRARGSPRACARSARSPSATACRSPTSFTRATATSTRSSSTTTGTPRSSSARRRRTRRCSTPVSRWAARSRASTAWVSTRPRISRSSTARPI